MLQNKAYTLSELREALQKSTNEFKPKLGANVEKDNQKNNREAVETIAKSVEDSTGGAKAPARDIQFPQDRNKTTLSLKFNETLPGKEWEERIQAQAEGYSSVAEKDRKEKKGSKDSDTGDRTGNKAIAENFKERNKEMDKATVADKEAGLRGRELDKYTTVGSVCENKMKRLHFKKTVFLSEAEAMSKVPSEYKVDGNRFYVKDARGTEYLMECHRDVFGYNRLSVVNVLNEGKAKNELARMRDLMGYSSSDYFTKVNKAAENGKLREDIDKVRMVESFEGDDEELINTSNDGDKLYKVGIWSGVGATLDTYRVWAFSDEEAIANVVAWSEENNPSILNDEAYEVMVELDGEEAADETFIYVDATREGASQPHYIYADNAILKRLDHAAEEKARAEESEESGEDNELEAGADAE